LMRLKSVKIDNMAAFESFETELPAIAMIQGKNGLGKSSLLACLKYAFDRGHDPDIIHGDAAYGEILVTFDNGAQVKARATRKSNETTRGWKAPGATRFTIGREQIDKIAAAISYDPLGFADLEPKQQVETLLRVMPIPVMEAELQAALGGCPGASEFRSTPGPCGLSAIDETYNHFYKLRREVNSQADLQTKHATALEAALPPPAPEGTDWETQENLLRAELARVETAERETIAEISKTFAAAKAAATKVHLDAIRTIDEAMDADIREVERRRAAFKDDANNDETRTIEEERTTANSLASAARESYKPQRDRVTTELATAVERARAQRQTIGTRKATETARQEAAALKSKSDAMTAALDRLQALKETVAGRLPIRGISFADGRLADSKGVPFAKWNTETQHRFCLKIGVLAHGEAGFLCLDDFEHFDSEKRRLILNACQKYAEKDGLQFLIATVTDGPLAITAPKPGSKCTWCAEGMPLAPDGQHQTAAGPIPCLEKG